MDVSFERSGRYANNDRAGCNVARDHSPSTYSSATPDHTVREDRSASPDEGLWANLDPSADRGTGTDHCPSIHTYVVVEHSGRIDHGGLPYDDVRTYDRTA